MGNRNLKSEYDQFVMYLPNIINIIYIYGDTYYMYTYKQLFVFILFMYIH